MGSAGMAGHSRLFDVIHSRPIFPAHAGTNQNTEETTMIIQIAHEVPAATVAKIQAHLDETAKNNLNWNGAKFEIERDEYTCIPENNSPDAVILLGEINRIIDGYIK